MHYRLSALVALLLVIGSQPATAGRFQYREYTLDSTVRAMATDDVAAMVSRTYPNAQARDANKAAFRP